MAKKKLNGMLKVVIVVAILLFVVSQGDNDKKTGFGCSRSSPPPVNNYHIPSFQIYEGCSQPMTSQVIFQQPGELYVTGYVIDEEANEVNSLFMGHVNQGDTMNFGIYRPLKLITNGGDTKYSIVQCTDTIQNFGQYYQFDSMNVARFDTEQSMENYIKSNNIYGKYIFYDGWYTLVW